jgi:V8-like Glu-specific endopeptidase
MICQLIIKFPGGTEVGTGWFGGPSTLFTAGHCVYNKSLGGRAKSITVWWPLNGLKQIATDWNCTPEWQKTGSEIYDFGFVHLPVKSEDWFSYGDYKDPQFPGKPVHVFGYPNDEKQQQPNPSLIGEVGYLDRADKSQLYYKVDTGGGQSGAPLFIWDSTSSHALSVGIHNYGSDRRAINYATRITADIVSRLNAWWK